MWNGDGENVDPASLRLSGRLLVALADWADFYDDVGGEISDADVLGEFVGQGYKLAHALRRELKGRAVWFHDPELDALVEIERRRPR